MLDQVEISSVFTTQTALYVAYMPFLIDGGIFIRTHQLFPLGTHVLLSISLPAESDTYTIETKIAWITPRGSQGNRPAGLGLQFMGENCRYVKNKIEICLADLLESPQMTDTM